MSSFFRSRYIMYEFIRGGGMSQYTCNFDKFNHPELTDDVHFLYKPSSIDIQSETLQHLHQFSPKLNCRDCRIAVIVLFNATAILLPCCNSNESLVFDLTCRYSFYGLPEHKG